MVKKIIKQLIPPLFLKLTSTYRNKARFYSTIHKHEKKGNTLFILGNGPSLKEQLENSCSIIASNPCVCVNTFVSSDFYSIIKPCIYVLADPGLFDMPLAEHCRDRVEAMWKDLFDKTNWNMDLVVPSQFRNNERIRQMVKNNFISILFCNMLNCSFYLNKKSQFKLLNRNLLSTPAQTVLNMAVYLAIFWRYKDIILLGADTSWHEDMKVDQKTNQVYIDDEHFHDSRKGLLMPIYDSRKGLIRPGKLHEGLQTVCIALESYWLLREYADYNSVSIYNASTKSWIDAFERKTLEELAK